MRLTFSVALSAALTLVACDAVHSQFAGNAIDGANSVQGIYAEEFAAALGDGVGPVAPSAFSGTLEEIQTARVASPDSRPLNAYLDVLEGMILLQTGQTARAALLRPDVADAVPILAGNSSVPPRDALFAESFGAMINGRAALDALAGLSGFSNADQSRREEIAGALVSASETIRANLCRRQSALSVAPSDQGAAFVAGNGATYLLGADAAAGEVCGFEAPDIQICEDWSDDRKYLRDALDLQSTFSGDAVAGTQLSDLANETRSRLSLAGVTPMPVDVCQ